MRLYLDRPSGTVARARDLRRNAPEPERRLLGGLREAFPHLKWRHQAPVGPYYADILCFGEKLVIEVDGDTHAATADQDADRTRFLNDEGYRVLRFWNNEVMETIDGVVRVIGDALSAHAKKGGTA